MSKIVHGEAQVLNLRLFLEGLEVPIIAATVDVNESAAAVAQLEIVGLDSAMRFKPRTVVHLFFFDGAEHSQTGTGTYRLLFMGELFSYTYQKTGGGSRSVILNCIDFSNYWDTSFIFQVSGEEGLLDVPQIQPFVTGSDIFANTVGGAESNISLLVDQLQAQSQLSQSVMSGGKVEFLSALMGILEMLGGVSVIDNSKPPTDSNPNYTRYTVHGGLSPWHTLSERRVRLLDQLATDDGKTASSMFEQAAFTRFLKKQSDLTSSVLSFRDILNLLMGHVYYSTFPNPCGRLLPDEEFIPHALAPAASSVTIPPYVPPANVLYNPAFLPSYLSTAATASAAAAPALPAFYAPVTGGGTPNTTTPSVVAVPAAPILTSPLSSLPGGFSTPSLLLVEEQLSPNFTYSMLTVCDSTHQAQNRIDGLQCYYFLRDLCIIFLEAIREEATRRGFKMTVNSGYRSPAVNGNTKGSSPNSVHMIGHAADLGFGNDANNWAMYQWIVWDSGLPFGEAIFEQKPAPSSWVHIALGADWGEPFSSGNTLQRKWGKLNHATGLPGVIPMPIEYDTRSATVPPR